MDKEIKKVDRIWIQSIYITPPGLVIPEKLIINLKEE